MRQHTVLFVSLVAGTVFFNACSDPTQPTSSPVDKVGFDAIQPPPWRRQAQLPAPQYLGLYRSVPML